MKKQPPKTKLYVHIVSIDFTKGNTFAYRITDLAVSLGYEVSKPVNKPKTKGDFESAKRDPETGMTRLYTNLTLHRHLVLVRNPTSDFVRAMEEIIMPDGVRFEFEYKTEEPESK